MGLAQLMMQCGMFLPAVPFSADICRGLFTHYKREEDATLESGKFDEELSRMSDIVDALTPDSMLLFSLMNHSLRLTKGKAPRLPCRSSVACRRHASRPSS